MFSQKNRSLAVTNTFKVCKMATKQFLFLFQRWQLLKGRAATTTCVIFGRWASRPSSWQSCSRRCSTCTRCELSSSCQSRATSRPRSRIKTNGVRIFTGWYSIDNQIYFELLFSRLVSCHSFTFEIILKESQISGQV